MAWLVLHAAAAAAAAARRCVIAVGGCLLRTSSNLHQLIGFLCGVVWRVRGGRDRDRQAKAAADLERENHVKIISDDPTQNFIGKSTKRVRTRK